jgi:hypothetical protein
MVLLAMVSAVASTVLIMVGAGARILYSRHQPSSRDASAPLENEASHPDAVPLGPPHRR